MKPLSSLLTDYPQLSSSPPETSISGIAVDSRRVQPGDVFVATSDQADGHEYIPHAIQQGAAAVIGTQSLTDLTVPYVQVQDARAALAHISQVFYEFPARSLVMIGVTGTDGKTTTANLLYYILRRAGIKTGMISTVNAIIGEETLDTGFHVTTPEAFEVQRYLRQMLDAGLTHVILETTSHGLAARRVQVNQFDIAVVTNITHEHLDYHGSYEEYRAAKARLFTGLSEAYPKNISQARLAVLNRDDVSYPYLAQVTEAAQSSYGLDPQAEVRAEGINHTPHGMRFQAVGPGFSVEVRCTLLGDYNVSNCLAAISAAVLGLGIDPQSAAEGIADLPGIPGRMERIDLGQDFIAMVDFAHTPNALKVALEAARNVTRGRVIAVFGSAGLRDRQKRRMMAETSAQLADLTVLTAEDPRTESLDAILAEMAAGAESQGGVEGETFFRVPDRGGAIRFAIDRANPGDLVVALGKGHEQSMCFIETEYLWDDGTAMRAALSEHLGVEGPEMPYLPTQDK
jgi:UDP-N-acetylmuramoyl-L-alanyl-D-glutamate--2,6-diaminopimelate ligase